MIAERLSCILLQISVPSVKCEFPRYKNLASLGYSNKALTSIHPPSGAETRKQQQRALTNKATHIVSPKLSSLGTTAISGGVIIIAKPNTRD